MARVEAHVFATSARVVTTNSARSARYLAAGSDMTASCARGVEPTKRGTPAAPVTGSVTADCSVEILRGEKHQVVNLGPEQDLADVVVPQAGAESAAEAALVPAERELDVPAMMP